MVQHDAAAALPACAKLPNLQHISIALGLLPDKTVWEEFLSRAGSRIRTAHLRDMARIASYAYDVLDVVNEWIAMLLLHCTGLESLELAMPHSLLDRCQASSNLFASRPLNVALSSLARLHTLGLWGLQLDKQQVAAMLQNCPLLEDCTLKTPLMTADVLAVLGHSCPLVRRVWLEGQTDQLLGEEAAESLLAFTRPREADGPAAPCSGWFSQLRVLYIDWMAGKHCVASDTPSPHPACIKLVRYDPTMSRAPPFSVDDRLIQLLPSLLAAAPLRYLHLPLLLDSSALLPFESFDRLRGLSGLGWMSQWCTEYNPYDGQLQAGDDVEVEQSEDEWWQKASDRVMAGQRRTVKAWRRLFRDVAGDAGSDGRTAFFSQLRKEVECSKNCDVDSCE